MIAVVCLLLLIIIFLAGLILGSYVPPAPSRYDAAFQAIKEELDKYERLGLALDCSNRQYVELAHGCKDIVGIACLVVEGMVKNGWDK